MVLRLWPLLLLLILATPALAQETPPEPPAPPAEEPAAPPPEAPVAEPAAPEEAPKEPAPRKPARRAAKPAKPKPIEDAGMPLSTEAPPKRDAGVPDAAVVKTEATPATVQVQKTARTFFEALLAGNARAAAALCAVPFVLEDRTLRTSQELEEEWAKQLRNRRTDLLALEQVEVLTPADAEKKYGPPPKRLTSLPWKNSGSYVVVGRFSGRPAVAIFKESGPGFRAIGFTD
jgi:hypothetical protein